MQKHVDDEQWTALKRAFRQRFDARTAASARRRGTLGPTTEDDGSQH
ncbi:hypothetical protein CLV49_0774 [Labedella gwakjiensis]|uniref:Uncharacterized protein n=1 Tax=Labedella gwakjiensis TaxID=390269 RepID=A0A2P8GT76_9MICO|nr:hypothetical protein [Labedella gwakjiensis]PSL37167.1 hypothetical protein CLV49_0774 [Labedella gwakjiensis]